MYVGKFGSVEQIQYFYQMTLNNVAQVWPINIILALSALSVSIQLILTKLLDIK